ncbi:MAG: glycosyltransferase family 2 protein [Deltaproteobacteria bacterium]|nr:glycosyltransferase family 2 protein [Deltaproteobacteria bacterium]
MLAGRRIAVVMPAYNEAKLIRAALEDVPRFVDHIIVVDDASEDATTQVARAVERPIELIEHQTNQGVGSAITSGCRHAFQLGAELTAVMAADGQMDPADLSALLAPLIAGEADYVKGNRLGWPAARKAMPWHRWLGNHVFSSRVLFVDEASPRRRPGGFAVRVRRNEPPHERSARLGPRVEGLWVPKRCAELPDSRWLARW